MDGSATIPPTTAGAATNYAVSEAFRPKCTSGKSPADASSFGAAR